MGASTPNDEESARQCWGNKQICAIKEETQNPLFIHKTTDEQFDIWRELRNIAQVAADEADARVSALTRKVETYDGYVEDDNDDISNINGRLVHADVDLRFS